MGIKGQLLLRFKSDMDDTMESTHLLTYYCIQYLMNAKDFVLGPAIIFHHSYIKNMENLRKHQAVSDQ